MFKKSDFHCMLDTQVSLIHVRKRCIQYMMFQKTEEKDLLVLCCFFSKYSAGEKFVILDLPLLYESGVSLFLMKDVIVVYW